MKTDNTIFIPLNDTTDYNLQMSVNDLTQTDALEQ